MTEPSTLDVISQKITQIHSQYDQYGQAGLAEAYEEFKREVENAESAAYKGEAGQLVLQRIKDLENLFATVTGNDVKELSMFMKDSEALRRTSQFASVNAEHIRFGDLGGRLKPEEFLRAARTYLNPDIQPDTELYTSPEGDQDLLNSLDWRRLSAWAYANARTPAPSYFLYGPLATQRRRAAPRARVVDDSNTQQDKTTPQNVTASELQVDPEQSTSNMVKTIYKVHNRTSGESRVNMFRFFINPDSFSQSVENLFYTSFLVRDGRLKVDVDDKDVPYVVIPDPEEDGDGELSAPISHQIATFDVPTWRALIEEFDIRELYIPHRAVAEDVYDDSESEDDRSKRARLEDSPQNHDSDTSL